MALDSDAVELDFVALIFRVLVVFGRDDLFLFLPPWEEELACEFAYELADGDCVADVENAEAHVISIERLQTGKGKRLSSDFGEVVLSL